MGLAVAAASLDGQTPSIPDAPSGEYVFTTLAGFKSPYQNAQLKYPSGVARDIAGNLYFSDSENHVIRKFTPAGVLTIFAGQFGVIGTESSPNADSGFWHPAGLAMDAAGNLYVGDTGTRRIRVISPSGNITTVAGDGGSLDPQDGNGTDARFSSVDHLALDQAGNLYVADSLAYIIRKVVLGTRQVSTIAGLSGVSGSSDGTGSAARFGRPKGIAADGKGSLYIVDHDGQTLRKMDLATCAVTTVAGTPGLRGSADGSGAAARFNYPTGLATDHLGNAFVADWGNDTVRKVTPEGIVTTVAGVAGRRGHGDGPLGIGQLDGPQGMVLDASGNLFIADWRNHLIRQATPAGVLSTLVGAPTSGTANGQGTAARFNEPIAPVVDPQGNVYLIDRGNYSIRKISPAGLVTTFAQSASATGMAIDASGSLYLVTDQHTVEKITPGGERVRIAGQTSVRGSADGTGTEARFNQPSGIALDQGGNLYVTDSVNSTIRKITPAGIVTTLAGMAGVQGFTDGTGSDARFGWPVALAVDRTGTVFVADSANGTIRRITTKGVVTTLAGSPGDLRIADGVGSRASFHTPNSLALDPAGDLLVVESIGVIRKVTAAGVVTTIGGLPQQDGTTDGVGTAARFWEPRGIAISSSGSVYITDTLNNTVRLGQNTPPTLTTQPLSHTVAPGAEVRFTATAAGNGPFTFQWYKEGVALPGATTETLVLAAVTLESSGAYTVSVSNTAGTAVSQVGTLVVQQSPSLITTPESTSVELGKSVTLRVLASGTPAPTYQWRKNGIAIPAATTATFPLPDFQIADAGAYDVVVANRAGSKTSRAAVVGVATAAKVIGTAYEYTPDIVHPNGTTYDQVLLTGSAAAITADHGQVTRLSFIDLTHDIVQVSFSGAGTLTVLLQNASGPALPEKYRQEVAYVRGHATLVITDADESTNVSIFSVGSLTAPNSSLYRETDYDGFADLALVAIGTKAGRFGGLRSGNGSYFSQTGLTGVCAPAVQFSGPLYLADLSGFDSATAVLQVGACTDARVAGGDALQANGRPVQIGGLTQLAFVAGTNSHGVPQPAQRNRATFEEEGIDVTDRIVTDVARQ